MNNREKHKKLGVKVSCLKKQMQEIYDSTNVKVKPGYVVESLDFGNGKTRMYYVFLDSWRRELCYVDISNGGSCGYNQVSNGIIHGTLVCKNGYDFVLSKYKKEDVSKIVINSFIKMVYEPKRHNCFHKRFCQWCGQRLADDMVD